ncbi:VOC family protein [Streptomyces pini]|uniref:VOC family protein n=1 Tax=Streptomyces pini TaxID=1520580 RepID=UPI001FE5492F|nr:VOC family protein [Streptomyces pini]
MDLFAGISVDDYAAAPDRCERLLDSPPTFVASETEAVREPGEHRSVFIEGRPEHAGHALHTVFVDGLDDLAAGLTARGLTARGLERAKRETCPNGIRKATYRAPEGNGIGVGGAPF